MPHHTPHPPILSSNNTNNNTNTGVGGSCNRLEPSHNTRQDSDPPPNMRKHTLKPRRSPTATLGCNLMFHQEDDEETYVGVLQRNGAISMMPEEQWYATPYVRSSGNVMEPPCIFQRRRNRIASIPRPCLRRGEGEMVEEDVLFGICSPPPRPTSRGRKEAIMVPSLRYEDEEGHCDEEEEEEFVDLRIMGDVLSDSSIENGFSRIGLECDGFSRDIFSPTPKRQSHLQTRVLVQKKYEDEEDSMQLRHSSSSAFGRHIPFVPR
mmetsp:Transcript_18375/g.23842  ORF Transcript_18375/g.23842 Transcript_18375/m.23842 type:complete len:264 (-) Transcript_18375:225-1016(-)|eukprot:CAMPEP_0116065652 /NCGR_PEP_ID=MMETSP0322-20121206/9905_1 /TAXON_ID=163516 /ORGANISM="Leptocylindrus danicus var. apora, Strain B651" /LENGTH=263 /DNA_ID=CAMNT_0003552037 /DNA_START=341 /DNA_END=1132 /DNA_ORIENTATION=-